MENVRKNAPLRVGIVGLQPGRSWAAVAHLPGLAPQPEKFTVVGVANRTLASAQAAAQANAIPTAYASVDELVQAPEIDLVAVTVRVPQHRDVVIKALAASKMIFCEWPLGKDLAEAEELTALAREKQVRTFIGTQALASPTIQHLKHLIGEQVIGEVLSQSLVGYGKIWGAEITDELSEQYLLDNENGATMLSIPVAHTLAAFQDVFGPVEQVQSVLATRRRQVYSHERQQYLPMTAPDQVGLQGFLADGSVFSLHYRGGSAPDGHGFLWEINGAQGVLRLTGLSGSIQMEALQLELCRLGETTFTEVAVPAELGLLCPGEFIPGNTGRLYAGAWEDVQHDTHLAPGFEQALTLHRLLDRIERAALPSPR